MKKIRRTINNIDKETLFSDQFFGKGIAKEINNLIIKPDKNWHSVFYRSAVLTKLFSALMRIREHGVKEGRLSLADELDKLITNHPKDNKNLLVKIMVKVKDELKCQIN